MPADWERLAAGIKHSKAFSAFLNTLSVIGSHLELAAAVVPRCRGPGPSSTPSPRALRAREYCCIAPAQSGVAHLAQHASASPCVTPVSASQVLLSLGAESGLFRLPDGPRPPHQTASLAWSSPPASVAVAAPFALGALGPDAVEARPIQALSGTALVQTLALEGGAGGAEPAGADAGKETSAASEGTSAPALLCPWPLADGSCLVARAGGRLVRLAQRPALAQAAALLELGEYEECLAVAAAAPAADLEARRRLEDVAHLRYAAALFRAGEFEGSMLHFGASGAASTLALLRLLPSLASPGHLEALAAQAGEELGAPGGARWGWGEWSAQLAARGHTGVGRLSCRRSSARRNH